MSGRGRWRAGLLVAALTGACAARPGLPPPITVTAPPVPALRATMPAVAMTPLVDHRPAAIRTSARPSQDERFSILLLGQGVAFVHGARVEGATLVAGDRMRIGGDAALVGLERWLAAAFEQASAQRVTSVTPPRRWPSADELARALAVPDGVVVMPILDQLDVARLSSHNQMAGGSSTSEQSGVGTRTVTTTSGHASLSSSTPTYANVRLRLLVVQVAGGQPVARHQLYLRGAGGSADEALARAGVELAGALDALFAPPPPALAPPAEGPPPPPTAPEPAPATLEEVP